MNALADRELPDFHKERLRRDAAGSEAPGAYGDARVRELELREARGGARGPERRLHAARGDAQARRLESHEAHEEARVPEREASGVFRLGFDRPCITPGADGPVSAHERKDVQRSAAGIILDADLRRLARAEHVIGIVEGELLDALRRHGTMELGYARLHDYTREELGISKRLTYELLWMHQELRGFPLLRAAFREGTLTRSKIRLLLRSIAPEEEPEWAQRARKLTVRGLEEALREKGEPRDEADVDPTTLEERPGKKAARARLPHGAFDEPRGSRIEIPASSLLLHKWDEALELCRKVEGDDTAVAQCVEDFLAEYLSGAPLIRERTPREIIDELLECVEKPDSHEDPPAIVLPTLPGAHPQREKELPGGTCDWFKELREQAKEIRGSVELAFNGWEFLSWDPVAVELPEGWEEQLQEPRPIHERLRNLRALRQRITWYQCRLLFSLQYLGLVRDLQFYGISHYATERLGMSGSRACAYASLGRRAFFFPEVLDAFREGRITFFQADCICRAAWEETAGEWIAYARRVPAKVLKEVVDKLARVESGDFQRWRRNCGRPPGLSSLVRVEPSGKVIIAGESSALEVAENLEAATATLSSSPRPGAAGEACGAFPRCARPAGACGAEAPFPTCARPGPGGAPAPFPTCARPGPGGAPAPFPTCAQPEACAAYPAPDGSAPPAEITGTLKFWLPEEFHALWRDAIARCRVELGPRYDGACEVPLSACVERILDVFLDTWKPGEKRLKEYAILERDNWTCQAPGCTCRRNLHVHHIIFRSREGSTDEPWNLITLCAAHHLQGVHLGLVTLSGRAPDGLTWGLAAPVRHLRWERLEIQARSVRT